MRVLSGSSLVIRNLTVRRGGRTCLGQATLTFEPGQVTGLLGPNGSGKTTLMLALVGAVPVAEGEILCAGRTVHRLPARERAGLLALFEQLPPAGWPMTVRELVGLGRLPHVGRTEAFRPEDAQALEEALRRLDLRELGDRDVGCLSGGERVRVHLARVLAQDTPFLLLDEPFAHLDPKHRGSCVELLRSLAHEGRGIVISLHDLGLASTLCDRIALLDDGVVMSSGRTGVVLRSDLLRQVFGLSGHESSMLLAASEHREQCS